MRFRCEVELGRRRPHDATARAKADPVLFLMRAYDHVEAWWPLDPATDYRTQRHPLTAMYHAMQDTVHAELAAGGIEVAR